MHQTAEDLVDMEGGAVVPGGEPLELVEPFHAPGQQGVALLASTTVNNSE